MRPLWSTIVAPILDVARPGVILDVNSGDTALAALAADRALRWEGSVASWELQEAPPVGNGRVPAGALGSAARLQSEPVLPALAELPNLERHTARAIDELTAPDAVELVLVHPHTATGSLFELLRAILDDVQRVSAALPLTLVDCAAWGAPTVLEALQAARPDEEVLLVPGLGGAAILADSHQRARGAGRVGALLGELRLSAAASAHLRALESERLAEREAAQRAWAAALAARNHADACDLLRAERDELRERARALAARLASAPIRDAAAAPPPAAAQRPLSTPAAVQPRPAELCAAELHALLRPAELLEDLGWPGPEGELALPIPFDGRGILDGEVLTRVAVHAGEDTLALRRSICSVLDRASGPLALSVVLEQPVTTLDGLAHRLRRALPQLEVSHEPAPASHRLAAGEELAWGWPAVLAGAPTPEIAYLLPGLPAEGSGGSHSLMQEARGLRALGAQTRICVPAQALATASALYGNEDELFVPYASDGEVAHALGEATVVVATEHVSVRPLELVAERRPELLFAYYVQDYEPLFAPVASPRFDGALLSYRAIPGMLLFAKTHWLRNVVMARHGVPVAKVEPSLDRSLFHAQGRSEGSADSVAVAAMVRPRTPRRRALATLSALALLARALGERAQVVAFGCEPDAFAQLCKEVGPDAERVTHRGLLTRAQVAELMRRTDVFIDASAYQAFGRTGLEAMACGAVPVLPALGGVSEYAAHDRDALVLAQDTPAAIADAVGTLLADRPRLERLRAAGLRSAAGFSVERAARSQLELFSAALARGAG